MWPRIAALHRIRPMFMQIELIPPTEKSLRERLQSAPYPSIQLYMKRLQSQLLQPPHQVQATSIKVAWRVRLPTIITIITSLITSLITIRWWTHWRWTATSASEWAAAAVAAAPAADDHRLCAIFSQCTTTTIRVLTPAVIFMWLVELTRRLQKSGTLLAIKRK